MIFSFIDSDGSVHLYLSGVAKKNQLVGLAGAHVAPHLVANVTAPGGYKTF